MEMVGADIKARIESMEKRTAQKQLGAEVLQDAVDRLKLDYDKENGGFGFAPKFPTPHQLIYLMHRYAHTGEKNALSMAENTLRQMRLGGILTKSATASTGTAPTRCGWFPTSKKRFTTKRC